MNNAFKLGTAIAQILPFHRHKVQKEFITNKLVIVTMAIIAIAKISILLLWI